MAHIQPLYAPPLGSHIDASLGTYLMYIHRGGDFPMVGWGWPWKSCISPARLLKHGWMAPVGQLDCLIVVVVVIAELEPKLKMEADSCSNRGSQWSKPERYQDGQSVCRPWCLQSKGMRRTVNKQNKPGSTPSLGLMSY